MTDRTFGDYARYYDLLYKDKDYAQEADYVCDLLKAQGIGRGKLLELGSGTGRHAQMLAERGFEVTGVELSPDMVAVAHDRLALEENSRIVFTQGDARHYRADRRFDAVISLFHVVSYQTSTSDLIAIFDTAATHLDDGGVFVFDFWHGPGVLTDPPTVRVKRMANDETEVKRTAEPTMDVRRNTVEVNFTISVRDIATDHTSHLAERHLVRYLFLPELEFHLSHAGFEIALASAWMDDRILTESDWYGVIVARKKENGS